MAETVDLWVINKMLFLWLQVVVGTTSHGLVVIHFRICDVALHIRNNVGHNDNFEIENKIDIYTNKMFQ